MKDITEFLKECRVNGNEKFDTNDDSFWKLKDLLEHYKEQCNIPVVVGTLKCDCVHSGSCRYEEVILDSKEICRHKE